MSDLIINLASFIVAISILVAVHEYGHYIVGRWTGMKVLRFSIGFGKPIWMRTGAAPDNTEYCISAIPLGGYVRFLDGREGPIDPADEGRAFNQRPVLARIAVLLAGPLFNFILAILLYWGLFVVGEFVPRPVVGEVANDSYAEAAGLESGDRIIAVDDRRTADWEAALTSIIDTMVTDGRVPLTVANAEGDERVVTIDVGAERTRLTEPGELFDGLGFRPWAQSSLLGEPSDDSAAYAAGLREGDRILAINGEPVRYFSEVRNAVEPFPEQSIVVEIDRDGRTIGFDVVLGSATRDGKAIGVLGFFPADDPREVWYFRQFGPLQSIGEAVQRTWNSSVFTVTMLGRMVTGDVSVKNISGPINIAQFAGETAQRGLSDFVGFLAIVSISLGVLNLLPVPVLDGGQIVYQLVEGVKGTPLSERAQIVGQQVGILALLLLMSFAFYNDIARILS
ncbi:MAG: RIP metalloprotease RseP [Woeseiaceae bacterium]|nr:RIP metalloprotease RseP [Woeseiaceae bacterium]